jgi:hypothetical protein
LQNRLASGGRDSSPWLICTGAPSVKSDLDAISRDRMVAGVEIPVFAPECAAGVASSSIYTIVAVWSVVKNWRIERPTAQLRRISPSKCDPAQGRGGKNLAGSRAPKAPKTHQREQRRASRRERRYGDERRRNRYARVRSGPKTVVPLVRNREILRGIRRGQSAGAHVSPRCFKHRKWHGSSRRIGPPG